MIEVCRLCLDRRWEKDPVKRKTRARQNLSRTQALHRCNEATHLGAPSRLKGPPPQTRAPILDRIDENGKDGENGTSARTH